MSWSYGLVETNEGELVLGEVYFNYDDKPWGFVPIKWKDLKSKKVKKMLLDDLSGQLGDKKYFFKEKDFVEKEVKKVKKNADEV